MSTELQKPTIFNQGNVFTFGNDDPKSRFPKLPVGTYLVRASMELGFYLEKLPDFDLPKKLYGNIASKADRILNTFQDRPKTTGVLLSGEKGSGKTLLTKLISTKGAKQGIPTLIVNTPFCGDSFNTFIQKFEQPCIVMFDEFEKVYDEDEQKQLLTLFDGIFTTKKLLMLTTNDYVRINSHLHNRPGRLYYMLDFKGLDKDFIMEYGQDNLKNKNHLSSLAVVASMLNPISFDILQAIVEESNRYNENPIDAMDMLNVKAQQGYKDNFDVKMELKKRKLIKVADTNIFSNPFQPFAVEYYYAGRKNKAGEPKAEYDHITFTPQHLKSFNGITGVYKFETDEATVTLTRSVIDTRSGYAKYEHLLVD